MKQLYCLTCGKELKDSKRFTCNEECFNNLNLNMTQEVFATTNAQVKMEKYQTRYCVYCGEPFYTNVLIKKSCCIKCCRSLSHILRYHKRNGKEYSANYYKNKHKDGWFLYKFMDAENNIIYIGRTDDIERRIKDQHFKDSQRHLPEECYEEMIKIGYTETSSEVDMRIYELYYISKLKPKYNKQCTSMGDTLLTLPDLKWTEYECIKSLDVAN